MRISDTELNKVVRQGGFALVPDGDGFTATPAATDAELIRQVVEDVEKSPDDPAREARVAELKARIQAGEYRPTGEEIADAMVRRAIADRIRP